MYLLSSKKINYLFALVALSVQFFSAPVFAASSANEQQISIITGQKTGTYFIFGHDIAEAAKKSGISVETHSSEGSIDNIKRITNENNIALGIVQSDVLGFLGRSKNPDSMRIAKNLRIVFPFYNEEIHVFAKNEIKDFKDLQGKKIAIGEDESGSMLTAINLFSIMDVKPSEMLKIPAAQGVVSVLKGEMDAMIFVGGKPVRLFKNLEDLSRPENQKYAEMLKKVHFVPMDSPKMLEEYKPAKITAADYNFVTDDVPTIAVPAILISSDISNSENKSYCEQIRKLAKTIRDSLPALKTSGHAKWKEVDLDANISGWQKDRCAWAAEQKIEKSKP
jgi:hypothetical protein